MRNFNSISFGISLTILYLGFLSFCFFPARHNESASTQLLLIGTKNSNIFFLFIITWYYAYSNRRWIRLFYSHSIPRKCKANFKDFAFLLTFCMRHERARVRWENKQAKGVAKVNVLSQNLLYFRQKMEEE